MVNIARGSTRVVLPNKLPAPYWWTKETALLREETIKARGKYSRKIQDRNLEETFKEFRKQLKKEIGILGQGKDLRLARDGGSDETPELDRAEIRKATKSLKKNKAPGPDGAILDVLG
ncbi:hypothetical protein HHI36_019983 [Cryptolaemus montrouzieri]|uniref:Uncharacterized protein n=1 Tax=Cryptolaemus montrouzieri TaxID=559131 RepID=A0ABD2N9B5_9CUCU